MTMKTFIQIKMSLTLTHISLVYFLWDICKQNSPICDAEKSGFQSVAIPFTWYMVFIEKLKRNEILLPMSLKMIVDMMGKSQVGKTSRYNMTPIKRNVTFFFSKSWTPLAGCNGYMQEVQRRMFLVVIFFVFVFIFIFDDACDLYFICTVVLCGSPKSSPVQFIFFFWSI